MAVKFKCKSCGGGFVDTLSGTLLQCICMMSQNKNYRSRKLIVDKYMRLRRTAWDLHRIRIFFSVFSQCVFLHHTITTQQWSICKARHHLTSYGFWESQMRSSQHRLKYIKSSFLLLPLIVSGVCFSQQLMMFPF